MRLSLRLPSDGVGTTANHRFAFLAILIGMAALSVALAPLSSQAPQKAKLPRPRQLDKGITWQRDPATGELRTLPSVRPSSSSEGTAQPSSHPIHSVTQMVPVTCSVSGPDGTTLRGLKRADFHVFEDGVEQPISYFDESAEPASVALVIDASPSVLRDSDEMKQAARALVEGLAPADEVAIVDFSAHTYLQLSFSSDRELLRRAVARVDVRQLLGDIGGSNIYEAVYLSARELFRGRTGRKAIVLLTDGQDSGLGLTLDPASASPQPGRPDNRLTFDDVTRTLAAEDIQIFAVSTENHPVRMTPEWIASHQDKTLLTPDARRSGIPAYTLYLAELVRRTGGQLYFLREAETMADTFQRIAQKIRAEYTLGYYPASGPAPSSHAGWHQLRVVVVRHSYAVVIHRAGYYVPATQ